MIFLDQDTVASELWVMLSKTTISGWNDCEDNFKQKNDLIKGNSHQQGMTLRLGGHL